MNNNREWSEMKAGDIIRVKRLPYMTSTETNIIKGVVNRMINFPTLMINLKSGKYLQRMIKVKVLFYFIYSNTIIQRVA